MHKTEVNIPNRYHANWVTLEHRLKIKLCLFLENEIIVYWLFWTNTYRQYLLMPLLWYFLHSTSELHPLHRPICLSPICLKTNSSTTHRLIVSAIFNINICYQRIVIQLVRGPLVWARACLSILHLQSFYNCQLVHDLFPSSMFPARSIPFPWLNMDQCQPHYSLEAFERAILPSLAHSLCPFLSKSKHFYRAVSRLGHDIDYLSIVRPHFQ